MTCLPFGGKRTSTQILPPPELCVVRAGAVSVPSPVFTLLLGASAGQGRSSNPAPCEPWRNPQQHPSQGQGSGELLQELLNCSDLCMRRNDLGVPGTDISGSLLYPGLPTTHAKTPVKHGLPASPPACFVLSTPWASPQGQSLGTGGRLAAPSPACSPCQSC